MNRYNWRVRLLLTLIHSCKVQRIYGGGPQISCKPASNLFDVHSNIIWDHLIDALPFSNLVYRPKINME